MHQPVHRLHVLRLACRSLQWAMRALSILSYILYLQRTPQDKCRLWHRAHDLRQREIMSGFARPATCFQLRQLTPVGPYKMPEADTVTLLKGLSNPSSATLARLSPNFFPA